MKDIRCLFVARVKNPIGSMYGIFTYIYHKNHPNIGKYASPMDGMGILHVAADSAFRWLFRRLGFQVSGSLEMVLADHICLAPASRIVSKNRGNLAGPGSRFASLLERDSTGTFYIRNSCV